MNKKKGSIYAYHRKTILCLYIVILIAGISFSVWMMATMTTYSVDTPFTHCGNTLADMDEKYFFSFFQKIEKCQIEKIKNTKLFFRPTVYDLCGFLSAYSQCFIMLFICSSFA